MNTSEKRYFIPDLESGFSHEVSKETYESYRRTWDLVYPKFDEKWKGLIQIFGTSGEMDNNTENMFYEQL